MLKIICPTPLTDSTKIQIGLGGGGRMTRQLIEKLFLPGFSANEYLSQEHDGAAVDVNGVKIAMSTDSYVVHPIFFPGGDIGTLAVNGTVNDLCMCGAKPLYLSAGFILEEGFPVESLQRIVKSMDTSAKNAGVQIVTGDTKVVDRGKGDGIYINTAGIGHISPGIEIMPSKVSPGDAILLSGDIGRHGISIMASREGLQFETAIESDCAPLAQIVGKLMAGSLSIHCMRDLTRGGLGAALIEIAQTRGISISVDESRISVSEPVRAACEILGLDPLYVANEGRFIIFVPQNESEKALQILQSDPSGKNSAIIGQVGEPGKYIVTARGSLGTNRILDLPRGEQLPRIC